MVIKNKLLIHKVGCTFLEIFYWYSALVHDSTYEKISKTIFININKTHLGFYGFRLGDY